MYSPELRRGANFASSSKYETESTPELNSVKFGDVVHCVGHSPEYPLVIIEVDEENDLHHGIAIVDEANNRFGLPGTIPTGTVMEVVGHRSYQQVVEMLATALGSGQATQEIRDRVMAYYPPTENC